jgi:DNA helicase HerA-like ATPase
VDGIHIIAELQSSLSELSRVFAGEVYPIGQFGSILKIHVGRKLLYAFVGRLRMKSELQAERGIITATASDERIVEADLFGEGVWKKSSEGDWELSFERGISTYPLPQQTVYLTPKNELRGIYGQGKGAIVRLGNHVGSVETPCYADMNELLGKHTAILGSTGSGKSGTVAAVLHSLLEKHTHDEHAAWKPRIIILDPHGEYGGAFDQHYLRSTDNGTLDLPYWLMNLEETVTLLIGKTTEAATSQSNIVKNALYAIRKGSARLLQFNENQITVDSPIPYPIGASGIALNDFGRTSDDALYSEGLIGEINKQRPDNKNKKDHEAYNKIIAKIESLRLDPRLNFLMKEWNSEQGDSISCIIEQLTNCDGHPCIVDLSGVPNEIAGIASAIIARTLFSIKVWQTTQEREEDPVLLVCEEAHRYVPNRGEAQYEAAQEAIRRIAKEGRKYGIGLLLVSQRPSEVEATVLSQCNSWIVLRITNEADREHVRSILPDSMSGLTKMLSGLRRQEAIFVGQAAMIPSRIMIRTLETHQLPKSHDIDFEKGWQHTHPIQDKIMDVVKRWRYQQK